ncbi:MAG: PHP domain-containing protein [Planctomycetota bacterium]|nr:MAG: PHP domain-containing protein [Planctomycetota bacterium]
MALVDFHMHSSLSDGALSPQQLLSMIRARGLAAWAITDHDTLAASVTLAAEAGWVSGVELTCWAEGHEIHMVGLGMDPEAPLLSALLTAVQAARRAYLSRLCRYLREDCGLTEVHNQAGEQAGSLIASRSHLANFLVGQRLVTHHSAAFTRWLGDEALAGKVAAPDYPDLASGAAAIRAAGGLSILAHPAHYRDYSLVERWLASGHFDGVETDHPRIDGGWRAFLKSCATRRGLLESCGSDFHFPGKRRLGDHCHRSAYLAPLLNRLRA